MIKTKLKDLKQIEGMKITKAFIALKINCLKHNGKHPYVTLETFHSSLVLQVYEKHSF
ncbi:hypothetical protein DBR06_SOUSAS310223 [Sousa chinensis]|uniref:Uncharacterized protein n=1 Tax=Sousa chinensis TaxID=103600 RepID=A0A484GMU6_SOUCH|nr:hypothetical protein DBR06_SOUSAS310223 [Sousa chinensis]